MVDVHTQAVRSKNMRAIASQQTAIEKQLAAVLVACGIAFRVQDATLPGKPDFVIDDARCVIFTHGCFWHQHGCYLFKVPATRPAFWLNKIGENVQRDRRNIAKLLAQKWRVLVVWECAMRGKKKLSGQALADRVEEWVCSGEYHAEIDSNGIHQVVED